MCLVVRPLSVWPLVPELFTVHNSFQILEIFLKCTHFYSLDINMIYGLFDGFIKKITCSMRFLLLFKETIAIWSLVVQAYPLPLSGWTLKQNYLLFLCKPLQTLSVCRAAYEWVWKWASMWQEWQKWQAAGHWVPHRRSQRQPWPWRRARQTRQLWTIK